MWKNEVSSVFEKFLQSLNDGERERIHTLLMALKERGPFLSRPHCDTIKCTKISNLKELRVNCKANPIRVLFAFDSDSVGIVLCAGKKGGNEKRFYKELVAIADKEFSAHLKSKI